MTEHYEMPHPLADYCQHAGVGKACEPCRRLADAAIESVRPPTGVVATPETAPVGTQIVLVGKEWKGLNDLHLKTFTVTAHEGHGVNFWHGGDVYYAGMWDDEDWTALVVEEPDKQGPSIESQQSAFDTEYINTVDWLVNDCDLTEDVAETSLRWTRDYRPGGRS